MPWYAWIAIAGITSYTILEIFASRVNIKLEKRIAALEEKVNNDKL